jgi:hypothetical protein
LGIKPRSSLADSSVITSPLAGHRGKARHVGQHDQSICFERNGQCSSAVSALTLCTTPLASGAMLATTGAARSDQPRDCLSAYRDHVADQTKINFLAVDRCATPLSRKKSTVLTRETDRHRAVGVDQSDQIPPDLTH